MDAHCRDVVSDWPDQCHMTSNKGLQSHMPSAADQSDIRYYTPFGGKCLNQGIGARDDTDRTQEDAEFAGPEELFFSDHRVWQKEALESGLARMAGQANPLLDRRPDRSTGRQQGFLPSHNDDRNEDLYNGKRFGRPEGPGPELGWNGLGGENGAQYDAREPDYDAMNIPEQFKTSMKDLEMLARSWNEHRAQSRQDSFGRLPVNDDIASMCHFPQSVPNPQASQPSSSLSHVAGDKKFASQQPKPSVERSIPGRTLNLPFSQASTQQPGGDVLLEELARLPPHLRQQYVQYLRALVGLDYLSMQSAAAAKYGSQQQQQPQQQQQQQQRHPTEFWPFIPPIGPSALLGVDGCTVFPQMNAYALGGKLPIFVRPGETPCDYAPPFFQFPQFVPGMKAFR